MTAPFPKGEIEGSIPERFRRVARAHPNRPAVREASRVVTYAELEGRADAAAAGLASRLAASKPTAPVALFARAGSPLFAGMLGTLSAGRFYVPLDPGLPDARISPILLDLEAAAVVAETSSLERARALAPHGVAVLALEELLVTPTGASDSVTPSNALPPVSAGDLAYVLFTSGSTGRPKGVMQSHRNVLHNVWKLAQGLSLGPEDRITLLSSPSFGASVSDIYGALLTGASVCPFDLSGDGLRRLPEFLEREAITVYHSVPSVFRSLSTTLDGRADLSKLRVVKLGGEAVLTSDFDLYRRRLPRSCVFHVGLGSTEMNVIRQWFAGHDTPWPGGTPLGYAVDETEVVLLGEDGAPNGGDEGEIGVIARTLPVGYWKDPERTAATFLPVPGRPDARLYRTGDFGRMLPDGCLLHLGRRDARLKIRGHRVEASEVEAALLEVSGVREAAVDGRPSLGGVRLIAWVAGGPGVGTLRRALARRLPASMVPATFVRVEALPRTATGKLDRAALPQPGTARPELEVPFREPSGESEPLVAGAFALVLGLDRVGADDDFFELGGDSLSAVELLAVLSERSGRELAAADLLEHPTPAALAALDTGGTVAARRLVRLSEGEGRPVFVIPGGGGDDEDLFAARRLARVTRGNAPFFALRSGPAPHPALDELAVECVREVRAAAPGPYVLVGDCMGGILAFAVARRLREEGERVALLALLDTPFPGFGRRARAWIRARAPRADRLWTRVLYFGDRIRHHAGVVRAMRRGRLAYLRRVTRIGAQGLDPPLDSRRRQALARRASYLGSLAAGRPRRFDGMVHVVECARWSALGHGAAWGRLAAGSRRETVAGDHDEFLLEHGDEVGGALARWLAEAEATTSV
jgi:amino acid adenylation domain-containing protein